jgi:FAD/FMN-containing dehydrogenase
MNKIATYLNEHLLGEVSSSKAMRRRYSRDGSVLTITPEIIVFPRVTNDIRKVARFAWQLAEKGHPLALTVRGSGTDTTGAAIGKGIIVSTAAHLNKIIHIAPKDKLAHVQPGVTLDQLQTAIKWQGLSLANLPDDTRTATVGGVLSNNAAGQTGFLSDAVDKLEVVLANGDLIETGRISRRDLSKKQGSQTFEGEIYRKLEALVEDNEELLTQLANDPTRDNVGYRNLAKVREKDGSFDLTPLFMGSQGTLGIISEVVLKTDFYSQDVTRAVISLGDATTARDLSDRLKELEPSELHLFDGELFRRAVSQGAQFSLLGDVSQLGAVIYIAFNDFSDRAQAHKLKKLRKLVDKMGLGVVDSLDKMPEEFEAIVGVGESLRLTSPDDAVALPLIDGAFVPADRREEFAAGFAELTSKHHSAVPVSINVLFGVVTTYPIFKLDVVSDKQRLFKLMNDYADLVHRCGGALVSDGAEGRLKANAAWSVLEENEVNLYEQLRLIFDPFGTLNPGVKQKSELRGLVSALRTSFDVTDRLS